MKMLLLVCVVIASVLARSPCDKYSAKYRNMQFWIPMESNCHMYLVCVPVGSGHRPITNTCGFLFWDQSIKTCVPKLPASASCNVDNTPPTTQPTTTYPSSECTFEVNPNNERQFRPKNTNLPYQTCKPKYYFSVVKCTCLTNENDCDKYSFLKFEFENNLKDTSCTAAQARVAEGYVTFARSQGNTVAVFNGNGYIDIPIFRNLFAGNYMKEFSVSMFFRTENTNRNELLFDNGNLYHFATVLMGYKAKENSVSVAVRISGGKVQHKLISATLKLRYKPKEWQHVAYVYNNGVLSITENGHTSSTKRMIRGPSNKDDVYTIDNLDEPLSLGGRSDGNYYYSGMMDSVRVFKRALSMKEIQKLALEK